MDAAKLIQKPMRWDSPFSPDMTDADVDRVMSIEPFCDMNEGSFPPSNALRDIIRNDMAIRRYENGDIVVRKGDYGNSAFLVLKGKVRVIIKPDLPSEVLGRQSANRRGWWSSLTQLWKNPMSPEVRDPSKFGTGKAGTRSDNSGMHIFLQDVPTILNDYETAPIGEGEIFGEIAALARTPRQLSLFAEGETELLEIRWQGLRDIRRRVDSFRDHIDRLYRERTLLGHLQALPLFRNLDNAALQEVVKATIFETHGEFEWQGSFKKLSTMSSQERLKHEPVISAEGDYVDGVLLIRSGFGRLSLKVNNGNPTISFMGRGEVYGLEEVVHNWKSGEMVPYQHTLRGLGNVDILRVPTAIMEEIVLPTLSDADLPKFQPVEHQDVVAKFLGEEEQLDTGLMEFLVENRFINGRATMLIDLDRCVRCDDCVRACASTHNNNPRFARHGKRYNNLMVANACMHCVDPVCMIGCPTGAIHRSSLEGQVVINDSACIGCATCANSCPYDNIRTVDIRDETGEFILDHETNVPIVKATKCDLCVDQMRGPACEQACPHDALRRVNMSDITPITEWLNKK